MDVTKIVLTSLAIILMVALIVTSLRMHEVTKVAEDGTKVSKPFTGKDKFFAVGAAIVWTIVLVKVIVAW